jgi:hypothetical protein
MSVVIHAHIYHHSHHRDNLTAPYGRSNLRSRVHIGHNQERGPRSLYGHVVALERKKICSVVPKVSILIDFQYHSCIMLVY